jgi:hypothetical protein
LSSGKGIFPIAPGTVGTDLTRENLLVLYTSVESWNKTLHFQAGDGPLLDKIELPPD